MARLDIRQLLRFFDGEDQGARPHSNAMNALLGEELGRCLLVQFLTKTAGYSNVKILQPCTQGTKQGKRLDSWVAGLRGDQPFLFQVEVKSWCAHSYGEVRALPVDVDAAQLSTHLKWLWNQYTAADPRRWDALKKVLVPMKTPAGFHGAVVEPVACVWDPLNDQGKLDPWFKMDLPADAAFRSLWWFSSSVYLRGLLTKGQPVVDLPMPLMDARLRWINEVVAPEVDPQKV